MMETILPYTAYKKNQRTNPKINQKSAWSGRELRRVTSVQNTGLSLISTDANKKMTSLIKRIYG